MADATLSEVQRLTAVPAQIETRPCVGPAERVEKHLAD